MTDFTLSEEDAAALRQFAALDPREARSWLQDRPDLARRMTSWPPELKLEVCRILYRSFPAERIAALKLRRAPGSNLLDLLEGQDG